MLRMKLWFILIACLTFNNIYANNIPILCYHNFNPTKVGSMNLKPQTLEDQLQWLKNNGFHVVPLKDVVAYLQGTKASLPDKSVVITIDDGWESAYKYLYAIVRKYHIPVTLFVYPETISKGPHAMTWAQLHELQNTGLFDIQGHTYSHPNFKQMKRSSSAKQYERFVDNELINSKKILEDKLGKNVTLLAWPFGIYDPYLEQAAKKAGYTMAFTIDARPANQGFRAMAQPRYMILQKQSMEHFMGIVNSAKRK